MLNYIKSFGAIILKPDKTGNNPIHMQIEPTTACNLRCIFCIREKRVKSPTHLSFDKFKFLYDEIKPKKITFAGDGEPFLCPDIFKMVSYAKKMGSSVIVTSNFTIGDKLLDNILISNIDAIRISIDATSKQTYLKVRRANYFDRIINSIKELQKIKKIRNLSKPTLSFEFVIVKENIQEIENIILLGKELEMERVNFRPLNLTGVEERETQLIEGLKYEDVRATLLKGFKISKGIGLNTNLQEIIDLLLFYWERYKKDLKDSRSPICLYPWLQVYISVDGLITPCCALQMDEGINLGNVFMMNDFQSVWNGERFVEMRKKTKKRQLPYKSCKTCETRGIGKILKLAVSTPGFLRK